MKVYELLTRDLNDPHWHSSGLYAKEEDAEQAWSDILVNIEDEGGNSFWYAVEEHKIQIRTVYESVEFNVNVGYDVTPEQEKEFLELVKSFFNDKGVSLDCNLNEPRGRASYTFKQSREGS